MLSLRLPIWKGEGVGTSVQMINMVAGQIVAIILLILCFYYASSLFWRVFYAEGFKALVPTVNNHATAKTISARGQWDWFVDTTVVKAKALPPSRLKANLIGVIALGKETGKGLALINYKGQDEIYRVGDEIASAVVLTEISGTYVTLQRDDKVEILEIEKSESLFTSGSVKDKNTGQNNRQNIDSPRSADNLPKLTEQVTDATQFKQLLRKEPLQLLNLFNFDRVNMGKITGFSLSAKRDDGQKMLDSIGLRQGDVLIAVNGAPVVQVPANPRLWKALLKAKKIKFKVLRDGTETEISV